MFLSKRARLSSGEAPARCMTEPVTKLSREMPVVAKTGSIGNFAESLTGVEGGPALQKTRGVIQTERIDEFTAGRAALCKHFLEITQRNPGSRCGLARTKIRIGETVLDDTADTNE